MDFFLFLCSASGASWILRLRSWRGGSAGRHAAHPAGHCLRHTEGRFFGKKRNAGFMRSCGRWRGGRQSARCLAQYGTYAGRGRIRFPGGIARGAVHARDHAQGWGLQSRPGRREESGAAHWVRAPGPHRGRGGAGPENATCRRPHSLQAALEGFAAGGPETAGDFLPPRSPSRQSAALYILRCWFLLYGGIGVGFGSHIREMLPGGRTSIVPLKRRTCRQISHELPRPAHQASGCSRRALRGTGGRPPGKPEEVEKGCVGGCSQRKAGTGLSRMVQKAARCRGLGGGSGRKLRAGADAGTGAARPDRERPIGPSKASATYGEKVEATASGREKRGPRRRWPRWLG